MSMGKKGEIIVFSAASGAGKTTLLDHLRSVMPALAYSISVTSRQPRPHERDGVHYFFISVEEFKKRIEAQEFAEWAVVHDNYYGTPKSFIDATINSGRTIIMDIDVYGKKKFDALYPDATGIFIQPPSLRELETRLRNRKTDPEEAIRKRLANAQKEMLFASQEGKYEYTIVNSDLEKAKQEVLRVVKQITGA